MEIWAAALALGALIFGAVAGWFVGRREGAPLRAELDKRTEDFRAAITDLASASERARASSELADERGQELARLGGQMEQLRAEREAALTQVARLSAEAANFDARLVELREAKDQLAAQFRDVGTHVLGEAQQAFLTRAEERFRQSEELTGKALGAMLQPVTERLSLYEEAVRKVEAERRDAFSELRGQLDGLRTGQEKVSAEAAKLVNALRNAPKARGRWGEQQLRNVLETCGLSEHTDFQTEVSFDTEEGRMRPDAIVRVPGGRSLVIDAKVSLNAYQDAFAAVDENERSRGLIAHAAAMRAHVNALGAKAYWSTLDEAPDYVIMFVPGEHFLSAALEQDPTLWDFAFEKRVLLATPTNLIAIARTVAAVWRQEKLAKEAAEIGKLGKELHDRLAVAAAHLRTVGAGLTTAVNNYNKFVGSFERNVLSSGRKFLALNIEPGAREIEEVAPVEALPRYGEPALLVSEETAGEFGGGD